MKKKIKCMLKKIQTASFVLSGNQSGAHNPHCCSTDRWALFSASNFSGLHSSSSRFLASLFKSLFSYTVPLGSDVWACPSAQCAFSASVQDMRGRALKHSPSPRWVHRFAEAGRKDVRRSMMRCGNLHVLSPHPFIIVDNSPITWVTSRYWSQRWTYTQVW